MTTKRQADRDQVILKENLLDFPFKVRKKKYIFIYFLFFYQVKYFRNI